MAFPSSSINTTNLDSDTDSPAAARPDLYDAVVALNAIIESADGNNGVPLLNGSGKLNSNVLPSTMNSSGTMTLNPSNGVVAMPLTVRLQSLTVAQASALTGVQTGDMILVDDGDSGEMCLAVYDGSAFKRIEFGNPISEDSSIPPLLPG